MIMLPPVRKGGKTSRGEYANRHSHGSQVLRAPMLFQLDNVTKTYGKIKALKNLSVDVLPGAVGLLAGNCWAIS